MISPEDAKARRIILSIAQILRVLERENAGALLKAFFNDIPLISAGKCTESPGPFRVEIG
jgi:hypothetical protein